MPKKRTKKKKSASNNKTGIFLILLLAALSAAFFYIVFLRPATSFKDQESVLYIPSKKASKAFVKGEIKERVKTIHFTTFLALAEWTGYWDEIRPGKYVISKNSGIFTIFRMLHGGHQSPVKLTINKFRTRKDLAAYVSGKLECTESEMNQFINSKDSLDVFGVNQQTLLTMIIPNTYDIYWNTTPKAFFERMSKESNKFWDNQNRIGKAKSLGLSKEEIYTVASIIEEETNNNKEKPDMASVYLNRLKAGMALGADPTIKFAVGDFSIKRVTLQHINSTATNPYNTYKNKGLPPGPICTPSVASIDAVLEGKKTAYLYFCAKEDFSGAHNFAATAEEHFVNARKYRKALDSLKIR